MRGCLVFIVGIVLGIAVSVFWWPRVPAAQPMPAGSEVQATVSDTYLTKLVLKRVSSLSVLHIRTLTINSEPPSLLIANAQIQAGPLTAPAAFSLQPYVLDGVVRVRVINSQVGYIPVPGPLREIVTVALNDALTRVASTRLLVTGLRVTPGGMQITAIAR